jgi:hypothetical protein
VKLYFRSQSHRLADFFADFAVLPLSYTDPSVLIEKTTRLRVPLDSPPADLAACDLGFLFDYRVFPPGILRFAAQWQPDGRCMRPGDVIVQQAAIPPGRASIKCVFAVRVLEVFRERDRAGFSYGTLRGHVERGVAEFAFRLSGGGLSAEIHTFSMPGLAVSRAVAPIFTLPYQRYCTRMSLERMRDEFLLSNPPYPRSGGTPLHALSSLGTGCAPCPPPSCSPAAASRPTDGPSAP